MKKIIVIVTILFISLFQNIYAETLNFQTIKNNKVYREYEVSKEENNNFYDNLEDTIVVENKRYKKINFNVTGGTQVDSIEVKDTNEIITKTNSLTEILNYLPKELEYDKDNYVGKINLNIDDIKVYELYNGYYEEYVEETKQYFDLEKNDLTYIPKEITKEGITLYLTNVEWHTQTTKMIGNIEITDLYRGEAHYKGVKKINYPSTYKVIAGYNGTVTKEIEKPYIYTVLYEEVKEENKQEKQNIVVPILMTTTSCIFVVVIILYICNKRVKVYNLVYGRYKYLGCLKLKNAELDLTKLKKDVFGNRYKFILNDSAFRKYNKKNITIISKQGKKLYHIENDEFEINL